jgi:WD40 repeat protein
VLWKGESLRPTRLNSQLTRLYSLAFSRDGRFLFTVGGMRKGEIEVWDTETEKCVWTGKARRPYWQVACSTKEDLALLTGQEDGIELWDFSGLRGDK